MKEYIFINVTSQGVFTQKELKGILYNIPELSLYTEDKQCQELKIKNITKEYPNFIINTHK